MKQYNLRDQKSFKTSLMERDFYKSNQEAWIRKFWENAKWEDFFSGERDEFLSQNFDLPKEIKEIQRLLQVIKNMQRDIEIGNEREIEFLAITILIDAYKNLYIDNATIEQLSFDDISRPYMLASAVLGDLWSLKRRKLIVEQINNYSSFNDNSNLNCIFELTSFANGEIDLPEWKIISISNDFSTVAISQSKYDELQQIIFRLSNFNNLSRGFYLKLRDKTNLEKQGANIMNHCYGVWFDSLGAVNKAICETGQSMAEEAELEEAMISILKKKFALKRTVASKFPFNFFYLIGSSTIDNQSRLELENYHLEGVSDDNLLEKKMALFLTNHNNR